MAIGGLFSALQVINKLIFTNYLNPSYLSTYINIFSMAFAVVEFKTTATDPGGLAIVNTNWLTPLKHELFWPPFKDNEKFLGALKSNTTVNEDTWKLFPVDKVFFQTDDYDIAVKKLKKAELTSNMESDEEQAVTLKKRISQKNKRFIDSSDSDEEGLEERSLPRPPPIKVRNLQITKAREAVNLGGSPKDKQVETTKNQTIKCLLDDDTRNGPQRSDAATIARSLNETANIELLIKEILKDKEQNKEILQIFKQGKTTYCTKVLPGNIPVELPVKTEQELLLLEKYLGDQDKLNTLILYFSGDGSEPIFTTNRILKSLLADCLACQYNFYGKRAGKKAFSGLNLKTVVVCKYNPT